eukprot:365428-Chlamydomonas_euryale.AAC.15
MHHHPHQTGGAHAFTEGCQVVGRQRAATAVCVTDTVRAAPAVMRGSPAFARHPTAIIRRSSSVLRCPYAVMQRPSTIV